MTGAADQRSSHAPRPARDHPSATGYNHPPHPPHPLTHITRIAHCRWYAVDEFTFTITLAAPYYPAVQELTYVRPLRFLSPAAFFTGTDSSGRAYNSCPVARGVQTGNNVSVACAGIRMPAGTGPLQFAAKVTNQRTLTPQDVSTTALLPGETVSHILFERFERYWGGAVPLASVTTPANLNSSAVKEGLLDGSIHMAYGAATLSPVDFVELRDRYPQAVRTFLSDPLQTRALLLHTGRDATASIAVRRAVNAALDKAAIRAALSLLELPADRLFATDMPYCNVDIGPLPAFSPAAADSLLAADGWVYPGPGATVRAKAGVPLQLTLLYVSTDPVHSLLVSVLLPQLAAVGVGVTAVGMAKQAFNAAMFAGNFSMGIIVSTASLLCTHAHAYNAHSPCCSSSSLGDVLWYCRRPLARPMTRTPTPRPGARRDPSSSRPWQAWAPPAA